MSRVDYSFQTAGYPSKTIALVIGLAFIVATVVSAATNASRNVSVTREITTPVINCTPQILWDQIGSTGTNGTASQDFETANDAFDAEAAEDFMVTSGQTWTIQKVVARGIYFNGSGPADSFNVRIGSSPGSGTVFNGLSYTTNGDDFEITLPAGVTLQSGIHWISVQVRMDFTPGGQWAWADRAALPFLFVARWRNPGGGYMIPQCVNFADRGATCGIDPSFPEQAFRLEGLIVGGTCSTPTATATPTATSSPCPGAGSLDTSFDSDGKVTTSLLGSQDQASSLVIQNDGKIVVAGSGFNGANDDFAFARYNVNGSLDSSFDGDGKVTTPILNSNDYGRSIAIQPDGKVIAAGYTNNGVNTDFAVVRYNADGSLDVSFNGTGKVVTAIGQDDNAYAVAIQPDGKVVVAGSTTGPLARDFALVRYNSDGSLDTSFNGTGKVITAMGTGDDEALCLAIQSDGKIVVAGWIVNGLNAMFAVARYNSNGTLDTTFGGGGKVSTSITGQLDYATSVAIQNDGRIVVAGSGGNGTTFFDFALVRYNTNGTLDTTFNGTGQVLTPIGNGDDSARSVVLQQDGRIVLAGNSHDNGGVYDFAIARFNGNGSLDTSFNGTGKVITPIGSGHDTVNAAAIDHSGRIVAAGSSFVGSNGYFALARYNVQSLCSSAEFDYDGDRKTDISVFRPSTGAWYLQQSQAGLFGAQFGLITDKITPADFDGDGKTDIAVYRPSTGIWYVLNSMDGTVSYYQFGLSEDLPTPADYDGDGKADVSVFRPSTGTWYRQNSGNGTFFGIQFGASEDKPTVGDFDGDGKSDIAVFRPSTGAWYQVYSLDGSIHGENFGFGTDILVPADYDGDRKTDVAVFRPSDGYWYARNSSDGAFTYEIFGLANDIPAPGDFDGDGKADINVFRPSDGTWYRQNSSNGAFIAFPFGTNGDKPTMTAFRY